MKYLTHYLLLLTAVILPHLSIVGQVCEGNISAPIFLEGFGSGSGPGPALPAGTTTYNYGAIGGGNYVVTNTSGLNGILWHNAPDHTPNDQNGYMLLFDASSTPGTFFRTSLDNLCPNTSYVFSCFAANIVSPSACGGNSQQPNLRFTILDAVGTALGTVTTGNIPTSSQLEWNEYAITFQTSASQTSAEVVVTNNAPGGCGNDLVIDDFSLRLCNPLTEQNFDLCTVSGGTVEVGQNTYTMPGVYTDIIPVFNSCNDSTVITSLTGMVAALPDIEIGFCLGDSAIVNGQTYYQTTTLTDTIISGGNCPQFQTYLITAQGLQETEQMVWLCNGDSLLVGQNWYSEEGFYSDTLQTTIGCDSIVSTTIQTADIEVEITPTQVSLELGESVDVLAAVSSSSTYSIAWLPATAFSCIDCESTTLTPIGSGDYLLFGTDLASNCMDSTAIQVEVLPCEAVYIPNAFSANYDGINDNFSVHAKACHTNIRSLHIFDRWGNLVYHTENVPIYTSAQLWDGRIGGQEALEGIYVYQIVMERIDGTKQHLSGDVLLLR